MFNQFAHHEQAFVDWRRDGYPGVKPETYQYIDFLSATDNDQAPQVQPAARDYRRIRRPPPSSRASASSLVQ